MNKFLEETRSYLQAHCKCKGFKVKAGGHYWNFSDWKQKIFHHVGLVKGLLIGLNIMRQRNQTKRLTRSNTVIVNM